MARRLPGPLATSSGRRGPGEVEPGAEVTLCLVVFLIRKMMKDSETPGLQPTTGAESRTG